MFKWKKMSQCRSSQAYKRKNQERGRLVCFLFLHTLLFPHSLNNYMTSLSVLFPRLNNSIALLFICIFLFLENSVLIALECQKGVFRSIWFHWLRGEKKKISANGWHHIFHFIQQKVSLPLFCHYLNSAVVHFLSKMV